MTSIDEQVRFMMLVGLAGSGKSTFSNELIEDRDDIVYLSSDDLREELFGDENDQTNHSLVFEEMKKRSIEALKNNKHVIYDATNVSRKRRKALLTQLPKEVRKIAIYIATDYNETLRRNNERSRVVPIHAINNMYKTLQIPIYSEGWDSIITVYDNDAEETLPKQFSDAVRVGVLLGREGYKLMEFLAEYFDEFFKVYDMPQDSKYHSFSVSRHIYYVYKHVLDNYEAESDYDKELMLWTALLHDVGKHFCKSFENRKRQETKYANFIGHEYVGSQLAVNFLKRLGFDDEFIHNVATLIQFHMYLLDENASRDKLKNMVGENMFNKLEFLREADTLAH
ncbi:polynucleotide kinase [Bacillus phage vB_BcoS-136]|uniref:Polynucleotide kinase n=1 Tax=Bacillus phage vB_BcoS-136 TaxID=2419619 RepID=A0A3G3BVP3_9CAUD|nr:polynucleotide kinase [Bacillus phage vB_BcoS-136]AYP68304.1 polynucleotide kinase [Bacillus phage vB_BcoS-136]